MPGQLIKPGDPGFLSPDEVSKLHAYDDLNSSPQAHHHSIGTGPNEVAAGTHGHGEILWLFQDNAQSIPTSNWTKVLWTDTEKNTDPTLWDIDQPNAGDVRLKKKGFYLIRAAVPYVATSAMAYMRICVNETAYQGRVSEGAQTDGAEMQATYMDYIGAVSYMSVQTYQSSGGPQSLRNTFGPTEYLAPNLQILYLGP